MNIQTLRSHRIFGIALFDLISSIIGTIIVLLIFWRIHFPQLPVYPFILTGVLLSIPLGIFIHIIFGINTKLNYTLGLSNKPLI